MAHHTIYLDPHDWPSSTDPHISITGDEAVHAVKAKRLREGDLVRLFDGAGRVAIARVTAARRTLEVDVLERHEVPASSPRIEVFSATPKGPRLDKMIDMLSQCGVALWRPLETARGVVDPGENKLDRIQRIAIESAKQAERAWIMEIGGQLSLTEALRAAPGDTLVIADIEGTKYEPAGSGRVRVFVGPEGGFTPQEIAAAEAAGARRVRLGPSVLRLETAAIAAAAVMTHAEQPG